MIARNRGGGMDMEKGLDAVAAKLFYGLAGQGTSFGKLRERKGLRGGNTCPQGQLTGYGGEAMMSP
jgi:hypothetical protein